MKDGDFGGTGGLPSTDVEGIKLSGKVYCTELMSVGATYYNVSEIEGPKGDGEVFQANLYYKF